LQGGAWERWRGINGFLVVARGWVAISMLDGFRFALLRNSLGNRNKRRPSTYSGLSLEVYADIGAFV
jgi:hypothetical protein